MQKNVINLWSQNDLIKMISVTYLITQLLKLVQSFANRLLSNSGSNLKGVLKIFLGT